MFSHFNRVELIMMVGPLVMFLIVLELVRRRLLREDYSLLWLATFGILLVLSLFPHSILDWVANMMGIFYPPTALFVVGITLVMLTLLQFSAVITKLAKQNQKAAQHIALLGARVHELESQLQALRDSQYPL